MLVEEAYMSKFVTVGKKRRHLPQEHYNNTPLSLCPVVISYVCLYA